MGDTISRQEAIDVIYAWCKYSLMDVDAIIGDIKALPSAQKWIPCSERLPEEYEWIGTEPCGTTISKVVYVTFETPDGERFTKYIRFQNGKLNAEDEQIMKVWYKGAKPIAWMPLPEPWKGET